MHTTNILLHLKFLFLKVLFIIQDVMDNNHAYLLHGLSEVEFD